jgi:hypothetical protein
VGLSDRRWRAPTAARREETRGLIPCEISWVERYPRWRDRLHVIWVEIAPTVAYTRHVRIQLVYCTILYMYTHITSIGVDITHGFDLLDESLMQIAVKLYSCTSED